MSLAVYWFTIHCENERINSGISEDWGGIDNRKKEEKNGRIGNRMKWNTKMSVSRFVCIRWRREFLFSLLLLVDQCIALIFTLMARCIVATIYTFVSTQFHICIDWRWLAGSRFNWYTLRRLFLAEQSSSLSLSPSLTLCGCHFCSFHNSLSFIIRYL